MKLVIVVRRTRRVIRVVLVLALRNHRFVPLTLTKAEDFFDGVIRDTLLFDLLRPDWIAAREAWRARERK